MRSPTSWSRSSPVPPPIRRLAESGSTAYGWRMKPTGSPTSKCSLITGVSSASKEVALAWADRLVGSTRMALSPDKALRGYFHGTPACLSALYRAERYQEIVDILQVETI